MRLRGQDLTCVRGERPVFSHLNFEVGAGEALAVTGANGSGKSSLLRILAGFITPEAGTVAFDGLPGSVSADEISLAERSHYLGHRDAFKASLTVAENLGFWRDYLGGGGVDLGIALETVGLGDLAALPAGFLSAGQRRRLSIARLLCVKRTVWLLDEPTSALDDRGQAILATVMNSHLQAGGLIVAATHAPLGLAETRELRLGSSAIGAIA